MDKGSLPVGVGPPVYADAAGGLSANDNLLGVAAETLDVRMDPFYGEALVA